MTSPQKSRESRSDELFVARGGSSGTALRPVLEFGSRSPSYSSRHSRDRYLELRLVHGTIKALELVDTGNGVVKLQLSQRFREPRRQRIGASPGDKERNSAAVVEESESAGDSED